MNAPSERPAHVGGLVSFLIVAHNAGDYLEPCVASALAQSYASVEIVLVDNASTDGSVARLARRFTGDAKLRVMHSETNRGPAAGALLGLPACRGEFIARLDADDIALPQRIERQVAFLRAYPEKDAVGADVLRIDAAARPLSAGWSLRTEFMRRHAAKWHIGCYHSTLTVRRQVFAEGAYNPTLFVGEDTEFIERIARTGRLGLVPAVLCLYRQHPASITERYRDLRSLGGNEVRMWLSRTVEQPVGRQELAVKDFSYLRADPRLNLERRARNRGFEDAAQREKNWLAASYFASIGGRWLHFGLHLCRAAFSGVAPHEVCALFLCRTAWPVLGRAAELGVSPLRLVCGWGARSPLEHSVRLAKSIDHARKALQGLAIVGGLAPIGYFALKPLPSARDVPLLSPRIVYFIDHHNIFCNVAAFAGTTWWLQLVLAPRVERPCAQIWACAGWLAALVAALEFAQLFIPRRIFDPVDIATGWLGIALASAVAQWVRRRTHHKDETGLEERVPRVSVS